MHEIESLKHLDMRWSKTIVLTVLANGVGAVWPISFPSASRNIVSSANITGVLADSVSKCSLEKMAFRPLNQLRSFCSLTRIDSTRVWEDFLLLRDTASEKIKFFLTSYVQKSKQKRFVLGAHECEEVRTVTSAQRVVNIWRALISAADAYVMEPKRRAQPKKAHFWRLQWFAFIEGTVRGPAFKLVLVSGLSCLQSRREC